ERKNATDGAQRIRALADGPPWYETITGSFSERFFGRYTLMGMLRPSCARIRVMLVSISGTSRREGRASFRSWLALPVRASTAQTSVGDDGVDQRARNRLPSSENSETFPCPSGMATLARGRSVRAYSSRTSVWLPASTSMASESPVFATASSLKVATGGFFST